MDKKGIRHCSCGHILQFYAHFEIKSVKLLITLYLIFSDLRLAEINTRSSDGIILSRDYYHDDTYRSYRTEVWWKGYDSINFGD